MRARTKHSLLWGVIGLLSFLVLIQGFELVTGDGVDLLVKAIVAVVVGVGATALTHRSRPRLVEHDRP